MSRKTTDGRRSFLKKIGAAGVGITLAGCTGTGGDGDGDGDGDGGTVTTTAGTDELEEISITVGANPWMKVIGNYMLNQGILEDKFNSLGFTPSVKYTYGGPSLFASGKTDIAGIAPTESVIMAATREFNVVITGKTMNAAGMMMVRPGSEFDPEEVGGQEAAINNIADNGVFGIGGWEGSDVKLFSVLFPEAFGLEFQQEGGDFTVNSTGDYANLPNLVVDGELDIADGIMTLNSYPHFLADPPRLTDFAFLPDLLNKHGFNAAGFGGIVARKGFADNNEDLLSAYGEAWQEATDWFYSNPLDAVSQNLDVFGGIPEEDAEFISNFGVGETEFADNGVWYETIGITDKWLEQEKKFLNLGVDKGTVPSNWADWAEFRKV